MAKKVQIWGLLLSLIPGMGWARPCDVAPVLEAFAEAGQRVGIPEIRQDVLKVIDVFAGTLEHLQSLQQVTWKAVQAGDSLSQVMVILQAHQSHYYRFINPQAYLLSLQSRLDTCGVKCVELGTQINRLLNVYQQRLSEHVEILATTLRPLVETSFGEIISHQPGYEMVLSGENQWEIRGQQARLSTRQALFVDVHFALDPAFMLTDGQGMHPFKLVIPVDDVSQAARAYESIIRITERHQNLVGQKGVGHLQEITNQLTRDGFFEHPLLDAMVLPTENGYQLHVTFHAKEVQVTEALRLIAGLIDAAQLKPKGVNLDEVLARTYARPQPQVTSLQPVTFSNRIESQLRNLAEPLVRDKLTELVRTWENPDVRSRGGSKAVAEACQINYRGILNAGYRKNATVHHGHLKAGRTTLVVDWVIYQGQLMVVNVATHEGIDVLRSPGALSGLGD